MEDIEKSITKKFGKKLSEAMLQGNIRAVQRAFKEVKGEDE